MIIPGLETTFNEVAPEYDRWNPEYVPALYDDIFAYQPLTPASRALEVGIGTGLATRPVLDTGCSLTAVELGDKLTAFTARKFRDYSRLQVINASFQGFEGEDGSFDLIYSASAFHWIPEEIGYPKVYALLKPGGAFARFARNFHYRRGQEELYQAIQAVYAVYMPGTAPGPEYSEDMARDRAAIAAKYGFTDVTYRLYRRTLTYTAAEYAAHIRTHSDHIALGKERLDGLCAGVEEAIKRFGGNITLYDTNNLQLARKPRREEGK